MATARVVQRDWLLIEGDLDGGAAVGFGGASAGRARVRLRAVFDDLGDTALRRVLRAYCIAPQSIQALERELGLPARSGKALFREALIRAARVYDAQEALLDDLPRRRDS